MLIQVLRTCIGDKSNDLSLLVHQTTSSSNSTQMTRNRMAATITLTTYAHHLDSLRSESQYTIKIKFSIVLQHFK